jgi:cytochrome c peroxidase
MSILPRRGFKVGALALAAAVLAGTMLLPEQSAAEPESFDAEHWRRAFARPAAAPAPPGNPTTPAKAALGQRLFSDPRLSGSNGVACSTCHQAELSFSDGVARRAGLEGEALARRTPSLWNLAWGRTFFWDGRARSLEDQAAFPIENRHEMGGNLVRSAQELSRDADLRASFAKAFPTEPNPVSPDTISKALAAFERTLVSPPTRFDRWVAGDDHALTTDEFAGLKLFTGKAGCVSCHTGWRFTDESFHDIGLAEAPPADLGRGAVLGLRAVDHAFKTPSLRERIWTAPYMHDGSLASLEDVVAHYVGGITQRPTLSRDLKRDLLLSEDEMGRLVAFLATLSSKDPPRPAAVESRVQTVDGASSTPVSTTQVGQKDRKFAPSAVAIRAGQSLAIVNDDVRTHTVNTAGPQTTFSSEAMEPGDRVILPFKEAGTFQVICGIHPEMRLDVTVEPAR